MSNFFGGVNVLSYVRDHYIYVLEYILLYLAVGIVWAGFKWFLFAVDKAEEFQTKKNKFYKEYAEDQRKSDSPNKRSGLHYIKHDLSKDVHTLWKEEIRKFNKSYPPQVNKNKATITRWMTCWVASLFWTLCHDFIARFYNRLLQMVTGIFQIISNRVFAKHKADFDEEASNAVEM